MRFDRTKYSDCKNCPLRSKNRVWGEGPTDAKIILLGEAPGRDEDFEGRPFVGKAGRFLNWGLGQANILRYRCWVTNLIACRPPSNDLSSYEGQEAVECCRKGFDAEMEFLKSKKVLVPLGAKPMRYVGIEGGISENRGSCFESGKTLCIPTFHPSFLARGEDRSQKKTPTGTVAVSFKYVWIADLKKIKHFSENKWEKPHENFNLFPNVEDVYNWTHHAKADKLLIAVDIETTSLEPSDGQIVVIGLATRMSGISIPYFSQHGNHYWDEHDWHVVKDLLDDLFSSNDLLFQNALYDPKWLQEKGFNLPFKNILHDTLLLHHIISPELPHRLDFIVSLYGSTPYWKDVLKKRDGSILDLPDKDLRLYNLRDADVLHQVLPEMIEEAKEMKTYKVYQDESIPLIKPIIKMMNNGFKLNTRRLKKWTKEIEERKLIMENSLYEAANLPPEFNLSSDDDIRLLLFGIVPNKLKNIEKKISDREKKAKDLIKDLEEKIRLRLEKKLSTDCKAHQSLVDRLKIAKKGDTTQLMQDLKTLLKLKENTHPLWNGTDGRKTDTGKVSVNEQGRLSLQRNVQNRLSSIENFKKPTPVHKKQQKNGKILLKFLDLYNQWTGYDKLLSTYSTYATDFDSRVHTHFLIHGTATGRLSSRNPNLQNIKKIRDKDEPDLRKCFVASPGMVLLSGDYSNLEVRVLAYETNDEFLIKALEDGLNIHDENTKILFGLNEKSPSWEVARRAAKIFMFGGISYGGGDQEIYTKVILEVPTLGLTFSDFKKAKQNYMGAHPKYTQWRRKQESKILSTRVVSNFTGRKRVLMGDERSIIKEGLNFPIQSGASRIINMATIRIDNEMEKRQMKSKMLLQVHDQLIFECPIVELHEMKNLVKTEMEREVQFYDRKVSFPVDLETGPSWGEMKGEEG